jgi:hypothetical protein
MNNNTFEFILIALQHERKYIYCFTMVMSLRCVAFHNSYILSLSIVGWIDGTALTDN